MFNVAGGAETPRRYRSTTWICYGIVMLLIASAIFAPLYSWLGSWMPASESKAVWIQRSGAITTLFSFMAGAMIVFSSGRLHTPGHFADANRYPILQEFRWLFGLAESLIFVLSIVGTIIWGYGDLLYIWSQSP